MKYKVGNILRVIKPKYDDKFIGDIVQVIYINYDYSEFPYRCRYLSKQKLGYPEDIFRARELELLSEDESMAWLI